MGALKVAIELHMNISKEHFRELAKTRPVDAAMSLEHEIDRFDEYLQKSSGGSMINAERQILKEYLGYKLVNS